MRSRPARQQGRSHRRSALRSCQARALSRTTAEVTITSLQRRPECPRTRWQSTSSRKCGLARRSLRPPTQ
eukprot:6959732-Alexandrium_andersonii.AAC.1